MELSKGGKITLIQAVLQSLPLYVLSVSAPPISVLNRLENMYVNFLWFEGYKHHWIGRNNLLKPVEEGGVGLRRLEERMQSFQLKQLWMIQTKDSLWVAPQVHEIGPTSICLSPLQELCTVETAI